MERLLRGSVGPDVQGGWRGFRSGRRGTVVVETEWLRDTSREVQNKWSRLIHGEQRKIVESTNWSERRAGDTEILARTEKIDRVLIEWIE